MEQKQTSTKLQDDGKLAYMIAWRDRRIAALHDIIEAQQQAGSIYAAYIAYLLERCGQAVESGKEIKVSKSDIRALCGKYAVRADDAGEDFVITLERLEETDGDGRSEMADA